MINEQRKMVEKALLIASRSLLKGKSVAYGKSRESKRDYKQHSSTERPA